MVTSALLIIQDFEVQNPYRILALSKII